MDERVVASDTAREPEDEDSRVEGEGQVSKQRGDDGFASLSSSRNDIVVADISLIPLSSILLVSGR